MNELIVMQNIVKQIKTDYRDKIHQLRWDEKKEIANKINDTFDKIFKIGTICKTTNFYQPKYYQIISKDDFYIYCKLNDQTVKLRKDEIIFNLIPCEGE